MPPRIFISYSHEEEDLAISVKDWIRKTISKPLDFFMSTDISPGKVWMETIRNELQICDAAILILSPRSVGRKWIHFEAGAAFVRQVPIIPVCCNGLQKSELTLPLSYSRPL